MPRDITAEFLEKYDTAAWNNAPLFSHCKRSEVERGKVRIVEAGDGTIHPIEADYLASEVHTLMHVNGPIVNRAELDRVILMVSDPISKLAGTYVQKYLRYGEKATFASKKSKAVPVPQRATCASRNTWYDLTYPKSGQLVWPKSQQYRHIVIFNQDNLIVNCNLYDVTILDEDKIKPVLLAAVLNSTLVALLKVYFGRYAGTEGNLKTEVVDVNLLEVPNPIHASAAVAKKLENAFRRLCERDTLRMVEDDLIGPHSSEAAVEIAASSVNWPQELKMRDRRDLDLAVFELLGVEDAKEWEDLCDQLYYETSLHFRHVRVVEIQKQEQRAGGEDKGFRTDELAAHLWDALTEDEKVPLQDWLKNASRSELSFMIPEGTASLPDADDMLDANSVFFRAKVKALRPIKVELPSRSHAEIIYALAELGFFGEVRLPQSAEDATTLRSLLAEKLDAIDARTDQLAASRTSDESKIEDLAGLLSGWMIYGRPEVLRG